MTKVLIVATYPIKKPQHGGQHRVTAIVKEYKKVFNAVRFVAVFPPNYYADYTNSDIALEGEIRRKTEEAPFTTDIICGQAIYNDPRVRKKFEKLLRTFKPDIIQIEQVFPYLGLEPLLKELDMHPKLILSSHNIEYLHKIEILESVGYHDLAEETGDTVRQCEEALATSADLCVAVSESDAAALRKMGATNCVVAANGIARYHLSEKGKQYWADYKQKNKLNNLITFVGSAHPPNWFGLLATVGDRMGFVPPDSRLVLAGSIVDYFKDNYKDTRPEHATFWNRVHAAGRLSDEMLTGLLDQSEVLLLPITEGGGSNLKTAEAILSGKKVVATEYAFRAFEAYAHLPNIFTTSVERFRETILEAIKTPYVERTKEQTALAERVQWHYCLQPMVQGAKRL